MNTTPTARDLEALAAKLTEAQREIMLGEIVDIPPEEVDGLKALGLKGEEYIHDGRLIWPITNDGLQLRAHITKDKSNG